MPSWTDLLTEIKAAGSTHGVVRRKYLEKLARVTGRNVIAYYSGWLEKPDLARQGVRGFEVDDGDKNGFMATVHRMNRAKGLDLLLHTPGGDLAATESIVDYLRAMFGSDVRAIVPQLAMSAGTMIALSTREIVMGKHSSLGPIDPLIGGMAAHGVVEEFNRAAQEISQNQMRIPLWQPIIAKYSPTLIGECQKAIAWSDQIVRSWLVTGMFEKDDDRANRASTVLAELADHTLTLSHSRHISIERARDIGLNVVALEDDQKLQDAVLIVHHAMIQTLSATPAIKIIENQSGIAHIKAIQQIAIQAVQP